MNKFKAIVEGWSNYLSDNEEASAIAKKRSKICASCPHSKKMGWFSRITKNDAIQDIATFKCELCQCPLSSKLRVSSEKCPENKW